MLLLVVNEGKLLLMYGYLTVNISSSSFPIKIMKQQKHSHFQFVIQDTHFLRLRRKNWNSHPPKPDLELTEIFKDLLHLKDLKKE